MAGVDMWRYGSHARSDAIEILDMVRERVGFPRARMFYEKYDANQLVEYEDKYAELVGQFIAKTATQRPAFLRRIGKKASEDDIAFFLVMCAQAGLRVHRFFDVHYRYTQFLVPGGGYRVVTQGVFSFIQEVDQTSDYSWPWDLIGEVWPGEDARPDDDDE
jgi:hypothetical protein